MPRKDDTPEHLRPFASHGVVLREGSNGQATGDCVFCGKAGKFGVNLATGLWRCYSCNEGEGDGVDRGGNALTFVRLLWQKSDEATPLTERVALAQERGLLFPETLAEWGVCRSLATGEWLVPAFNAEGNFCQLYRYAGWPSGKRTLFPTTGLGSGLFGANLPGRDSPTVYLCEGPWDALALWETLRYVRRGTDGKLALTGNPDASLAAESWVIAVPGANHFDQRWLPLFAGKRVILCYDSDHPKLCCRPCGGKAFSAVDGNACPLCGKAVTGQPIPPAGASGARKVASLLSRADEPPESISWIAWGADGYDPSRKLGFDVRDLLTAGVG